jgi:hypothetical protein
MIQLFANKYSKSIACLLLTFFYTDLVMSAYMPLVIAVDTSRYEHYEYFKNENSADSVFDDAAFDVAVKAENASANNQQAEEADDESGGPTQPEMQAFQSVNNNNMVDLFSGDFSYNIPLMDVGGYPINLSYRSGITMDQEASWVGLGWNINPGTITRNLRGLPDDFSGQADTIRKVNHIKPNQTVGVNLGLGSEVFGLPLHVGINGGVFYNNYKGLGLEYGGHVSIGAGNPAKGLLTAGLSLQNNSQEGLSITPTLSYQVAQTSEDETSSASGSISTSLSYNSRSGLKAMQFSAGVRQYSVDANNQREGLAPNIPSGMISFALPAYNPKMSIAYTSRAYSFSGKIGSEVWPLHPNAEISGYVSTQGIFDGDTVVTLPAYGYLNYQNSIGNESALLDYNRERDIPYREKPAVPHIALPSYTYDVFSITGEGSGGMFRAYRGDIGAVYDHYMKSRDASDAGSIDLGVGVYGHVGLDINVNRSYTQSGPWTQNNPLVATIPFTKSDKDYEAVYFKNPGEKSVNEKSFYDAIGGDDVVTAQLYQGGINDPNIRTTTSLNRFRNKKLVGTVPLTSNILKTSRDKRTQVISYLTAEEADRVGLEKYIENYKPDSIELSNCNKVFPAIDSYGAGLNGEYFANENLAGVPTPETGVNINHYWSTGGPSVGSNNFSARWTGFIKAPATGKFIISLGSDDGARLWLNDSLVINHWNIHAITYDNAEVNLVKDQLIKIRVEYFEHTGDAEVKLKWTYNGHTDEVIPTTSLFTPISSDMATVSNKLSIEKRINSFRKPNHISEIDVLNADGRRYVYGIPVYNFIQKDVSFSVAHPTSGTSDNLVSYSTGDNTVNNSKGQDNYYNSEVTPAYAHSFLLTAILSTDYVDVTGDGISDDDLGDAIKFNYSKTAGIANPYKWRSPAPNASNKASYNEGLKTESRDDKGFYVYGEKELWYLNTIESKNMVAVFIVANRTDLPGVKEDGTKEQMNQAKKLTDIKLYSKPDYLKNGTNAIPIKTVHFEYDSTLCKGQFYSTYGKLTLKKVSFTYNGNSKRQNPYYFHYASNPDYDSKAYDKWGNYKSASSNPGSMSNAEYPYTVQLDYTTSNKDSIDAYAAAWTLDSITLPSGGRIKVDYESDDYAFVQNKRAMQMFSVAGLGYQTNNTYSSRLYKWGGSGLAIGLQENLVVYATVNKPVTTTKEVFEEYLEGIDSIYFKMFVRMPTDAWGSGNEFVSCYASLDKQGTYYGIKDAHTIWFKIKGINKDADGPGSQSPLVKAALQFLRLNLPSKAYPGSDVDMSRPESVVRVIGGLSDNIMATLRGYENNAKAPEKQWCSEFTPAMSMVRLDNPDYKKYGGGLRVKQIKIYDNWFNATGQKESIYGQQYAYTTTKEIHGVPTVISSGVASYEPMIGGEENPWHVPIQYKEQASVLGPTTMGYSEEPLGESFFPSASVGYSKVRVRSINTKNHRSANGYEETNFYTTNDFPTITDRSLIDNDSKKRYKPALANFLRINAQHYLAVSQGFKVELNDMNGKMRSQATYPETDSVNFISYTENFYKVDDQSAEVKHLTNNVWTIDPTGVIDTNSIVGKDVEIMMDMREQYSSSQGFNVSPNLDFFPLGIAPGFFTTLIPMPQSERNIFHSVAITKVIQRYGILDSVIHIEKGSKVSTKNMIYDSETGDVVLTRTNNEFNDPVYNFSYPSHWIYDGMGEAYKNIQAVFSHLKIVKGKIVDGMTSVDQLKYFTGGDEIMIASHEKTANWTSCQDSVATFPTYNKIWAIDTAKTKGGTKNIFFIDASGVPFAGNDVSMKIIRSGRRNINTSVGNITMLKNPVYDSAGRRLKFNDKILNASAVEFKELWQVPDRKREGTFQTCSTVEYSDCPAGRGGYSYCTCTCLRTLFDFIIQHNYLYTHASDSLRVDTLVNRAANAGYSINTSDCGILLGNATGIFYADTFDSTGTAYKAHIGKCLVSIKSVNGTPVTFSNLLSTDCGSDTVQMVQLNHQPIQGGSNDTVTATINSNRSMVYYWFSNTASYTRDSAIHKIMTENPLKLDSNRQAETVVSFNGLGAIPSDATIFSANLVSTVASGNHWSGFSGPMTYVSTGTAHVFDVRYCDKDNWDYNTTLDTLNSHLSYASDQSVYVTKNSSYSSYTTSVLPLFYNGGSRQNFETLVYEEAASGHFFNDSSHFSTFNGSTIPPYIAVRYLPYDTIVAATLQLDSCLSCTVSSTCISVITDTVVNPYRSGLLGNYRTYRSYVFYTDRTETDPNPATSPVISRRDGTYDYFIPFDSHNIDTTHWVWNSESTLFNQKGFELENKDPLGRYNAGLYGYNLTLPIAIAQNSKYREAAFEGFEDYSYKVGVCDTSCSTSYRQLDYSLWESSITDTMHHTGKYALRINHNDSTGIGIGLNLTNGSTTVPQLTYSTGSYSCSGSYTTLNGILADSNALVRSFSPTPGDSIVVSGWIREQQNCLCTDYIHAAIILYFYDASLSQIKTDTIHSIGNLIEGWQRFEKEITIPATAKTAAIVLKTDGQYATFFDDLRIHPYNSSMKSFVYDPINLRLTAELDENNYATFYEYDDDGTLVRVKKETERGIKTIKETRSVLTRYAQ